MKIDKTGRIDAIKLPDGYSRRVKLTDAQRIEIRFFSLKGASMRLLAGKYGVSKRLIQFTVYPERLAKNKAAHKERAKDGRYRNREAHRKAVASLRAYKRSLIRTGVIPMTGDLSGYVPRA